MTPEPPAPGQSPKPRVAVVFGGRSSEHAISCVTAGSVLAAIDPEAYEVVPVGIAPDGRWVLESGDPERLRITTPDALPAVDAGGASLSLAPGGDPDGRAGLVVTDPGSPPRALGEVDVVFPLLHGPWGEDGTLQGMLEMSGVRYVGAGVLASAVGMDKAFLKVVLRDAGLPVMPSVTVTRAAWQADADDVLGRLRGLADDGAGARRPVFVKPARGGSSMGIAKVGDVTDADAVRRALEGAFEHDPKVLVELAAEGAREVECGVLDRLPDGTGGSGAGGSGAGPETSVPAEVLVGDDHDFYDFEAKYLPEQSTRTVIPADLDPALTARVRTLSARAFAAVGCEGLARVDFFVMPDGSLVVNEINTMPGFTPTSMFPQMWAATGLSYPDLVDRLIRLALARGTGLR